MTQGQKPHSTNEDRDQNLRVIEQVDDILWTCDLNLKLTYVSSVVKRTTGFSAEERKQLSLEKTLSPASISRVMAIIEEHASIIKKPEDGPDTPLLCLLDIYRKDGSTYPAEASISFTRNDQGELTGLVGSNRNISERVRAEAIIKAIHDGTIHATGEQYLNNLVCQLCTILTLRYAFIAKINNGTSQTLAFCNDGKIAKNITWSLSGSPCENIASGALCVYPKNAIHLFPNNPEMHIESYICTPVPDVNGEVQGMLVLMDDQPLVDTPLLKRVLAICADRVGAEMSRRETQNRLEESEQCFRALFDQSLDPCFIHDSKGIIIDANQSMEHAFGYSIKELRQLNATQLVSTEAKIRTESRAEFQRISTTGSSRHETRLRRKSGDIFPAEVTSQLINLDGQQLVQSVIRDLTEQYRLRQEKKQTQQTLAKLFNDLHTIIGILNIDGSVTYSNNTPLTNQDAYQAATLDTKLWEYRAFSYNPAIQLLIKAEIAKAIQGQHTQSDMQILSPSGLTWVQVNIHPLRDDNGKVTQLLIEGTDIDQRKKMAAQLLDSNQHRKLFREQAPMPVIEWNTKTLRLSAWNNAAEKLFGYSFEEIEGKEPSFLTPEGIDVNSRNIRQTLRSTHSKIISKNRCKNGRIILCEWYNSPIKDSSGSLIAVVSIVRDITAEHQAQQLLRNRDAEQREILDTMLDAVFTVDESGAILTFNKAAEKLFGHTSSNIIGQSCWQVLAPAYVTQHQRFMQRYLQTKNLKYLGVSDDLEGQRKDGTTFPSRLAIAPLGSKNGKQQFIVSMPDLTHAKQQEEKLRRSQKMDALGKLTGGIAHDFNNMLGVIMGYADLLQLSIKDQPKLEKYAEEIYRAGQRGAQLTEKLLGFSRQKVAAAERISINDLLQAQQHMLAKSITPRIKLVYDFAENLWPVYMDSGDLVDAILNISINAMHAMPEGGQLSFTTENERINVVDAQQKGLSKGDYVSLSISDTGCGMDQETQEKIFDPFFTTKGDFGTGLGLSQVYGFVERSKGSISIYSEPGHGTRLTLYLPRHYDIDTSAFHETQMPATSSSLSGKETILVVDDEVALLNLSTEILRQQGYEVIPVTTGQQALEILKTTPISLLLSDVIMPEMDGYQLATAVQAQYPQVKIQLASGFTDDRHSGKLDASLLENIIKKPFSIKELLTTVRQLLEDKPQEPLIKS